jgi:L-threonylcarbamoyladenylate synthase
VAERGGERLGAEDARRLGECLAGGGVAIFPTDTVYGLGCDPENETAVRRLYELKGRPPERPAAVMFFRQADALMALAELGEVEREAVEALLPGPVTLLLPNPARRFPLACAPGDEGAETLGLRVPRLGGALGALAGVSGPAMQSSANISGERDARRLQDVPSTLLDGADLVLDGGELPGTPSTVIDLREYRSSGRWRIVRAGAMSAAAVRRALPRAGGA